MKNNKEAKNIIIFVIIILGFIGAYILIDKYLIKEDVDNEFLKNYEVNEYIPTYISDEDLTKIYLNEYVHIMYTDIEKAYELLDKEYKEKKFGGLDAFEDYINSLTYTNYKLDRFYVNTKGKYTVYGAFDTNGNMFIFKTNGVMQYTVYLDDYTVEI